MLTLTRKHDEDIVVIFDEDGPNELRFSIKVCELKGDKVKLGFAAPKAVRFYRRELLNRIEEEGRKELVQR